MQPQSGRQFKTTQLLLKEQTHPCLDLLRNENPCEVAITPNVKADPHIINWSPGRKPSETRHLPDKNRAPEAEVRVGPRSHQAQGI